MDEMNSKSRDYFSTPFNTKTVSLAFIVAAISAISKFINLSQTYYTPYAAFSCLSWR